MAAPITVAPVVDPIAAFLSSPVGMVTTQVIVGLLIALVAATVASRLSLRGYYRGKWWEAKMAAYSAIIEALHHIKRDVDCSIDAAMEMRDTEESDFHRDLQKKQQDAWKEVRKQLDVGEFLLSPKSVAILQNLVAQGEESDPNLMWQEHLDLVLFKVNIALPAIKAAAREDLSLPRLPDPPK